MKIRNGFVSNSSSSSFCLIGVSSDWAERLLHIEIKSKPPKKPNHGSDCECSKCKMWKGRKEKLLSESEFLNFRNGYFESDEKDTVLEYYGSYSSAYVAAAGFDAEKILETKTLPQAKLHVQAVIKEKIGEDIPLEDIGLRYGEVGDG